MIKITCATIYLWNIIIFLNTQQSDTRKWLKAYNVKRYSTHGGKGSNENCSKILLNKNICYERIGPLDVDVFENFKKVVEDCFSVIMHPNVVNSIDHFRMLYYFKNFCKTKNSLRVFLCQRIL